MSAESRERAGGEAERLERMAWVALGSNLGDSAAIMRRALMELRELAEGEFRASSLYRTLPVDCPEGSAPFINAAAGFAPRAEETPESLLGRLQRLEREFGRRPKAVMNEPRPLDLDLIAFGREVRNTAVLAVPHPRAHERRFVLAPLAEIAPGLVLPGRKRTVAQLLAGLRGDEELIKPD